MVVVVVDAAVVVGLDEWEDPRLPGRAAFASAPIADTRSRTQQGNPAIRSDVPNVAHR